MTVNQIQIKEAASNLEVSITIVVLIRIVWPVQQKLRVEAYYRDQIWYCCRSNIIVISSAN